MRIVRENVCCTTCGRDSRAIVNVHGTKASRVRRCTGAKIGDTCASVPLSANVFAQLITTNGSRSRKPVQIRRGPATVRGSASFTRECADQVGSTRHPLAFTLGRESHSASSQETCPFVPASNPRGRIAGPNAFLRCGACPLSAPVPSRNSSPDGFLFFSRFGSSTAVMGRALVLTCVVIASPAVAQVAGELRGRVSATATLQAIPHALVELSGHASAVRVAPDGTYIVRGVVPGSYTISVRALTRGVRDAARRVALAYSNRASFRSCTS